MEKIIGACGLLCGECGAYKATQANDADAVAKVAAEWTKLFNTDVWVLDVDFDEDLCRARQDSGWRLVRKPCLLMSEVPLLSGLCYNRRELADRR